ncbi:hypothetical protein [Carboxylicivirga sp. N1Y90]|uniref:hypothetical protein n=1 Tax=Carboxylicivirga fragile TaxID=3417571 RepID=UPI003D334449|nr:hypothetical protein [Marinilabiliaceae bacterium N1Y90]
MKKRTSYLIIGILFISLTALGQTKEEAFFSGKDYNAKEKIFFSPQGSRTKVDMERTIELEHDSKTEEVFIEIKEKDQQLLLVISSSVRDGKLTIELYDPNNTKQGNYTIETQLQSKKKEQVNGNIRKAINEPQSGNWRVKIIPKDVTGDVKIVTVINE